MARSLDAGAEIGGHDFQAVHSFALDGLDGEITLPGMRKVIVRKFASDESNTLHNFLAEILKPPGLTHAETNGGNGGFVVDRQRSIFCSEPSLDQNSFFHLRI